LKTELTKVALVDLDNQIVPDWVAPSLHSQGVELLIRQCNFRAELAEHAREAEIVWLFGGSKVLQGGALEDLPRCRAIVRTGSGTDNVPVAEATSRGIVVANTPAALSDGVSDHVIALIMALVRRLPAIDRAVRAGIFDQRMGQPLNSFRGRNFGLVGFGHIARDVARKLSGFGLNWLVHDPFIKAEELASLGFQSVSLETLLAESDYVSLHCPLTPSTRKLIGEPQFRRMKPTAILINTSRGPVVDESALIRALTEGWIAAAGLDVFEQEPLVSDSPLLGLENVILTPHSASMSGDGMEPRWRCSVETVAALARGFWPPSCVNREVQPAELLKDATLQ
jgi:D-3-phosphoglycerate dehydrogenase / 2-oxoglutarate reductase